MLSRQPSGQRVIRVQQLIKQIQQQCCLELQQEIFINLPYCVLPEFEYQNHKFISKWLSYHHDKQHSHYCQHDHNDQQNQHGRLLAITNVNNCKVLLFGKYYFMVFYLGDMITVEEIIPIKCSSSDDFPIVNNQSIEVRPSQLFNGKSFAWYNGDDGKTPHYTCTYVNGLRNGQEIGYYENGNIRYRKYLVQQPNESHINHGHFEEWYGNGTKMHDVHYDQGKLHGHYKVWYKNGNTQSLCRYHHGNYHGNYQEWYDDNTIHIIKHYKHGKLHGQYIEHSDSDGHAKIFECNYRGDFKQGKEITRFNNGAIKSIINYHDGEIHGMRKNWYENGVVQCIKYYKHGIFHGKQQEWDDKGHIISERNYHNGNKKGLQLEWY